MNIQIYKNNFTNFVKKKIKFTVIARHALFCIENRSQAVVEMVTA